MEEQSTIRFPALPLPVRRMLEDFVVAARKAFGAELYSAVLYGSAAEGRLRATSDVNLILVLTVFTPERAIGLREPFRVAQAAITLTVMFLLVSEMDVAHAFAGKFADIVRRRFVVYGLDPFTEVSISRTALIARLQQALLNLSLRLRGAYVLQGLREEQLALVIADAAGPLRSCAAGVLELGGHPVVSPRDALASVAAALPESDWSEVLSRLSLAREQRLLPPGVASPTLLRLVTLTQQMRARVDALR